MKNIGPLRKRWLLNIGRVVGALGLVCVLAVTAVFASISYSELEEDLKRTAGQAAELISSRNSSDMGMYIVACAGYAEKHDPSDGITIRWQRSENAAKDETASGEKSREAISSRGISTYVGADPDSGERVMAVSCPMVFSDGEVIGVLRFSASTRPANSRIISVFCVSLLVLLVVVSVVIVTSNLFIRSVLDPISQINEKAKTIAAGSYGARISIKYDDEIGDLADTVNELSAKISQNEKMQAEFISSLSHELRTPLTVINGWSETLLLDESMDPETQRGLKIISGEAKRLTEMVVDLLDFTRLQDGKMTLAIEEADVRGTFEDTVYMYRSRLSQEGIALNYEDSDEDIPEIPCDPQRLRQVFLNILDNAAKHGGEGKRIDASICCEGQNVVIRIRDYGPGIPEDEIPLVKKKFYKGSSKARGTGIGLAISDEIVQMHGGTLTLENAEDGGTLVTVQLPQTH